MLIISTSAGVVGAFFLSDDLDLIRATPFPRVYFFFQRLFGVLFGTSVMSFIFLLPVLAAYYSHFHQGLRFLWYTIASLIPFFIIPGTLSFLVALFVVGVVPRYLSRFIPIFVLLLLLVLASFGVSIVKTLMAAQGAPTELYGMADFFSRAELWWAPSTWIGEILGSVVGVSTHNIGARFGALYGVSIFLCALSFIAFWFSYEGVAGRAKVSTSHYESSTIGFYRSFDREYRQWAALIHRDIRLIFRDMSQVLQCLMLVGILTIYLSNIKILSAASVAGPQDPWWINFLFVANFSISAFIATALCTRFIFPSISLEGKSFFLILCKSPLSLKQYVMGRFYFWYVVTFCIHAAISCIGSIATQGGFLEMTEVVLCSAVLCYGLVGLAVGMGALFSRFDWESASQLAVGYGNIIFMLSAASLILLSIFPVWLLYQMTHWHRIYAHVGLSVGLLYIFVIVHISISRYALHKGISALEEKCR